MAAVNCIRSSPSAKPAFPEMLAMVWDISFLESKGLKNKVIYSLKDISF